MISKRHDLETAAFDNKQAEIYLSMMLKIQCVSWTPFFAVFK